MAYLSLNKRKLSLIFVAAALILSGCTKTGVKDQRPQALRNVRSFAAPPKAVWIELIKIVEYRMMFPMDIVDPSRGIFSTKMIRDTESSPPLRFRLSGALEAYPEAVQVKLYKSQQLFVNGEWKTFPTDYELEQKILQELEAALKPER